MKRLIRFLLSLPDFGSDLRNHKARFLNIIMLGIVLVMLLAGYIIFVISQNPWNEFKFLVLWFPIILILQILLRNGRLQLASYLFSFALLAMVNGGSIFFGGVISPNLGSYMAAPLISGLILGSTGGLLFTALSTSSAVLLLWLELTNRIVYLNPPAPPISVLIGIVMTTVFVALLTFYYYRVLESTVKKARAHADEQQILNQKLQLTQSQLDEKNRLLAMTNQVLEQRVHQRTQEIELISSMVRELHSCTTLEDAYPLLHTKFKNLFPGFDGRMWIIQPDQNTFSPVLQWGKRPPSIQKIPDQSCAAIQTGQPTFHLSPDDSSECFQLHRGSNKSSVCLPITSSGGTLGLLQLWHSQANFGWEETMQQERQADFQRLAQTITHQLAVGLRHIYLHMELQRQAVHDALTGLYNRRYMEEFLIREINRSKRKGYEIGLAVLDVDYFKSFNDNYGHEVGDKILKEISAFLKQNIRKEDIACRIGGEEFLIILPEISTQNLQYRMESIIKGIREIRLVHEEQPLGTITISAGAAIYPADGLSALDLVRAADLALYQSKNGGRNKLTFYKSLHTHNLDKGIEPSVLL